MTALPDNQFRKNLMAKKPQTGIWLDLASAYSAEMAAIAGFDWLLLDAEHGPNDLNSLLAQLQAVAAYPVHVVVRPPSADPITIKRYLDIGVQNLLIPMVDTGEQAASLVSAIHYPPHGIRGVGHILARASGWGTQTDYLENADKNISLIVQVETKTGVDNINEITTTDGVDGVFIGPADLAASMGHPGNTGHPEVVATINDCIDRILAASKSPGIISTDESEARVYLERGCCFVGVGADTVLLMEALCHLAKRFQTA
jgi:4-hydroxy-2-oxoheptanedioate aldolase